MRVKDQFHIFYWQKCRSLSQQVNPLFRELEKRNREPIMNIEFRRAEKGGSGEVFVK